MDWLDMEEDDVNDMLGEDLMKIIGRQGGRLRAGKCVLEKEKKEAVRAHFGYQK